MLRQEPSYAHLVRLTMDDHDFDKTEGGPQRSTVRQLRHHTHEVTGTPPTHTDDGPGMRPQSPSMHASPTQHTQIYTHEKWQVHRQTVRYARHVLHIPFSKVFRALLVPMMAVMTSALIVGMWETARKVHTLWRRFLCTDW